jgi:hypothetical protein
MKCPRCQHENPTGMKFCGQCAAPLASTRSSCGAANPAGNKFCGQCAAPLPTTPTTRFVTPDAYTPKHLAERILTSRAALEGERKQVTVLFADLKTRMLIGERGAYRAAHDAQTVHVPATVQAILAARMDRLTPEDKRLLRRPRRSARTCPSVSSTPSPSSPKINAARGSRDSKPPSSSTRHVSSPISSTPSSTP